MMSFVVSLMHFINYFTTTTVNFVILDEAAGEEYLVSPTETLALVESQVVEEMEDEEIKYKNENSALSQADGMFTSIIFHAKWMALDFQQI